MTAQDGRDWTEQPYPPKEPLFPNRRYMMALAGDRGGGARFTDKAEAIDQARALSSQHPGSLVKITVIEEAEPIGAMNFRAGRMETEGDAR